MSLLSLIGLTLSLFLGLALLRLPPSGLVWVITLPATLVHELAHWASALILGAKPAPIRLRLRKLGDHYEFGAVEFVARWWSAGIVALAPLVWSFAGVSTWVLDPNPEGLIELAWKIPVCAWFIAAGSPSSRDWAIALRYPAGPLVLLGLAFFALRPLL